MTIRKLLKFLLFALSFRIVEEGGGGGASGTPPAPPSDGSIGGAEPPAAPAAPVSSPAPAPTMLDAISAHFDAKTAAPATDPVTGQPRDPQGRFAPKDANGTPIPAPVAAAPVVPGAVPAAPVAAAPAKPAVVPGADDLTMPEGLQPKAQERFQRLADTVKTASAERDEARQQVSYVREAFQKHGVSQDQFEQATNVIGMLNTGNLRGALQVLDEQRRQISLALGEPLPGVDALSDHQDLRQAVDNMQITEANALELARSRTVQAQQQQRQQQVQQTQQAQQQEKQQVNAALGEVDQLVKHLQSTDIDFAAIEAQLIPSLKDLLADVPPNRWKNAVQAQYSLLKRSASAFRVSAPTPNGGGVLRPTGQAAPGSAPKTMHEAMFGPQG